MSAVSIHQTRVVLSGTHLGRPRFPPDALPRFMERLRVNGVEVVPFDLDRAVLAHLAHLRFGKGLHPAALDLVDCVAYALATSRYAAPLFKGDDFARTDVRSALA
jgi:ribonuclease VapC